MPPHSDHSPERRDEDMSPSKFIATATIAGPAGLVTAPRLNQRDPSG
jgi:hypothetical protein